MSFLNVLFERRLIVSCSREKAESELLIEIPIVVNHGGNIVLPRAFSSSIDSLLAINLILFECYDFIG